MHSRSARGCQSVFAALFAPCAEVVLSSPMLAAASAAIDDVGPLMGERGSLPLLLLDLPPRRLYRGLWGGIGFRCFRCGLGRGPMLAVSAAALPVGGAFVQPTAALGSNRA